MKVTLHAGEASLDDWRQIWRGAPVAIDPAHRADVAASAATVQRILGRGDPVYGINTGFGKLAGVRIESADLATLHRHIRLSHPLGARGPPLAATAPLTL